MGRILIGMMTLLLIIIPWSECYSTLDSFPHGHDTELSLLTFFAMLGLVLLFVRSAKIQLKRLLALRYSLLSMTALALSPTSSCGHGVALTGPLYPTPLYPPLPGLSLEICNLPLQI